MNILIVDDDIKFVNKIYKDLFIYFSDYYEEINIYSCVSDFLNINYDLKFNFIFIDIDLPNGNGIELAKMLKVKNPKSVLSFISAHINLIHNSLVVRPFYFIRKLQYTKDLEVFFSLIQNRVNEGKIIDLNYGGNKTRVHTDEIVYIEVQLHKLIIKTNDRDYFDNRSMKDILSCLPNDIFTRIHKSFVINMDYLVSYNKSKVKLSTNREIIIGRAFKSEFEEHYKNYLIK